MKCKQLSVYYVCFKRIQTLNCHRLLFCNWHRRKDLKQTIGMNGNNVKEVYKNITIFKCKPYCPIIYNIYYYNKYWRMSNNFY